MSETVVITGARAPVALHLARLFHAAGHRVVLADSLWRPLARATRHKVAYERLPPAAGNFEVYAETWRGLLARHAPALVIPTCEEVFYLAAARDLSVPLPLFAPALADLARVHDKSAFAGLAKGHGADPPETVVLASRADLEPLSRYARDLVFKPVWSRFGSRVLIRPNAADLARLALTPADPWIAQTYLPGSEICAYAVARDGVVRASRAYRPLYRAGPGASVAFAPCPSVEIDAFVRGIVGELGWTGQIAFDFKRDAAGALHVLECNPRATSGVHFFGADDGLADAMLTGGRATASETRAMTLPLAMLTYGLRDAMRNAGLARWARDFRGMADLAFWPGEGSLLGAQLLALAEIACRAARDRTSLQVASTWDIEWNGAPFPRGSAGVRRR